MLNSETELIVLSSLFDVTLHISILCYIQLSENILINILIIMSTKLPSPRWSC